MFDDFMNHVCNIYHLREEPVRIGFGIKDSGVKMNGSTPDETMVRCHFHVKSDSARVIQNEPHRNTEGDTKLTLPSDTDIRVNDIVENIKTGIRYRAGIPKEIYGGHHLTVMLTCLDGLEDAL